MFSGLRVFAPPEFPVLSLGVQARIPPAERKEQSQFRILVSHFLDRFFHNDLVSSDDDAKKRLLQVVYAIALPELVVALFLTPAYHAPLPRPYWSQVSDHYFFVLYLFVALGVVSIFAWDLFFPDLLDVFVLAPVSISSAKLFRARIVSACLFLGLFLFGASALGSIFYPLLSEPPQFLSHVLANLVGVLTAGGFAAGVILGLQSFMVAILGERVFRLVAPWLQAAVVMMLLTILLLFPVTSQFLASLINLPAARYFPPFWFLGIYESVLSGGSLPVFRVLAHTGWMALVSMIGLVVVTYPIAYRRKMRYLVEGSSAGNTQSVALFPLHRLLHSTLLRNPMQRGIYHFISHSLLRTHRHRVYLSMYAGLGLALLIASTVLLKVTPGHLSFALSSDGLRTAIPIVAFWTIVGLRNAFVSPTDRRGGWIFRVLLGRPGVAQLQATELWILPFAILLTLATVVVTAVLAPQPLAGWECVISQTVVAIGLCLLLTDVFFLAVRSLPFTGGERAPGTNFAFILLQYFGVFPPLVWLAVSLEPWLEAAWWHVALACGVIAVAHSLVRRIHQKDATYHAQLIDLDDDEEEFPQRLGLRY